jgi:hypothetical protein
MKVLEYCIRAVKYYKGTEAHHDDGESSSSNLVISLHVLAALHCQLGQYEDAVSVLERSLTIPEVNQGEAKSYCEAALWSYGKQGAGHTPGDVAHGLADTAAILEELNKRLPFSSCNRLSTSWTNHQVTSYSCPLERIFLFVVEMRH